MKNTGRRGPGVPQTSARTFRTAQNECGSSSVNPMPTGVSAITWSGVGGKIRGDIVPLGWKEGFRQVVYIT